MYVFEALSYGFRLVICTGFFYLIKSLVAGNQEGRVHHETGLGKGEIIQRKPSPLGNGVKEGFTCYQNESFQLG